MKHIFKVLLIMAAMASAVFAWDDAASIAASAQSKRFIATFASTNGTGSNEMYLILTASSVGMVYYSPEIVSSAIAGASFDVYVIGGMTLSNSTTNVWTNGSAIGTNMYGTKLSNTATSPARIFVLGTAASNGYQNFAAVKTVSDVPRVYRFYVGDNNSSRRFKVPGFVAGPGEYTIFSISNRNATGTNLNYSLEIQAEKISR